MKAEVKILGKIIIETNNTTNNTMIQWVIKNTRYRGKIKLSRLDLLLT